MSEENKEKKANSPDTPKEDSQSLPSKAEQTPTTLIAYSEDGLRDFLSYFSFGPKFASHKGKRFINAFEVGEDFVKKIISRSLSCFEDLDLLGGISFSGEVRYRDLTTNKYNDPDKLLEECGDTMDPETLLLTWIAFLKGAPGECAKIELAFQTDVSLETESLEWFEHHLASIEITVAGPTNLWVGETFRKLDPFLETAKIGGIYKPLLVFRNKHVVQISSWAIGVIAQISSIEFLSRELKKDSTQSKVERILNQTTLDEKFDTFVKALFLEKSSVTNSIMIFGGSFILLLLIYVLSLHTLPKLVPRSTIEIGLTKSRVERYRKTFQFIIFTLLVGGLLIPIIRSLFF